MIWYARATYYSLLAPNLIFNVRKKDLFEQGWLFIYRFSFWKLTKSSTQEES